MKARTSDLSIEMVYVGAIERIIISKRRIIVCNALAVEKGEEDEKRPFHHDAME